MYIFIVQRIDLDFRSRPMRNIKTNIFIIILLLFVLIYIRFFQILLDFPHATAKIPFEYLFDLIPPMQPRAMSIASSNLVSLVFNYDIWRIINGRNISQWSCGSRRSFGWPGHRALAAPVLLLLKLPFQRKTNVPRPYVVWCACLPML